MSTHRDRKQLVEDGAEILSHLSCIIHSGGLPRSIVAQEGGNLTLVEADAETIHSGSLAAAEHLDQVLDNDALHQVGRLCFEERVAYAAQTYNV